MLAQRKYRFGDFTLDIRRGALFRGATEVRLRPKSFGVLQALVERNGELVSKDELLELVWGRTVVTEGAVTQCLIDVRRALGDESQEIIRTVPRRGYLFTLPVTAADTEYTVFSAETVTSDAVAEAPTLAATAAPTSAPEPGLAANPPTEPTTASAWTPTRRMQALSMLLVLLGALIWWGASARLEPDVQVTPLGEPKRAPSAARRSIAVLPFANLTGGPDGEYVADGIADEIVHLLAQGDGFRVVARTSSFAFKGQSKSIDEIAKKLDVVYVVEGSVRRAGNSVRVNAQLIDAASSSSIWSKTYDRDMHDLLAVQEDIARHIATALRTSLASGSRVEPHVPEPAAYDAFLRARYFFQRRLDGDLAKSELAYREALRLDPRMARAWAGLAGIYRVQIGEPGADVDALLQKQQEAIDAALALDPQLADARIRAAGHYAQLGDVERAQEQAAMARELSPDDPAVLWWYANDLAFDGRLDDAIEVVRRLVVSDPASRVARANFANLLMAAGRLAEARDQWNHYVALEERPSPDVAVDLARIDLLDGRHREAIAAAEKWPDGPDRDFVLAIAGHVLQRADVARTAEARLRAAVATAAAVRLAELYARRNDRDEAFRWMSVAYDRLGPTPWLTDQWQWLYHLRFSPFLAPLRNDARWAPMTQRGVPRARTTPNAEGLGR